MQKKFFYILFISFFLFTFSSILIASAATPCGKTVTNKTSGKKSQIGICCEYGCGTVSVNDITNDCNAGFTCCHSGGTSICKSAPSPSSGGSSSPSSGGTVKLADVSPVGETDVPTIIGNVIKAVLGIIGAVALFMFVYGGILLLSSGGRQDQIKKGKDVLIWAIIGIAVILASYALVEFIISGLTATA
jgi:hypothetical protein